MRIFVLRTIVTHIYQIVSIPNREVDVKNMSLSPLLRPVRSGV